jgi:Mg2+-importing ATPase
VLAVVAMGAALPATPLGGVLGFVPLPWTYFVFVALATIAYLALVEVAKSALVRRGALRESEAPAGAAGSGLQAPG